MNRNHTLLDIERITGMNPLLELARASALDWYTTIREKPISTLHDSDLNQLIRHHLHTECILSECLHRLYEDPVTGAYYDGELLNSLATHISPSFWKKHHTSRTSIEEFLIMVNTFKIPEIYSWDAETEKRNYYSSIQRLTEKIEA